MKKAIEIIANTSAFSGLSPAQLEEVRQIAVRRNFTKGEAVFFEGDQGSGFYIVIDGLIKIFKLAPDGKEQILHIIGPGEPFGEVAVFAGRSFPANAEVLADSRLLFFPRDAFVGLISRNPSLALKMLAVLSMRLRQFTVQVESLSLKEVPGRLASYLLLLADEQDDPHGAELPIPKGQLASLLGTIPETLSRIFTKMAAQGLIEVNGRNIRIVDRAGLENISIQGKVSE
ncbi:MAG: Crp/Fnr family transcriptional regulator [Desulfobacterales bacterium]|jgi:CRP/FNR family transcriptional regulator, dissimilatory nitrate respiration regulator